MLSIKKCTHCQKLKCLSNFGRNKSRKDGLNHNCKECVSFLGKKNHKKHSKVNNRKSRDRYSLNKDTIKQKQKEYYSNNREKVLLRQKVFRENNKNYSIILNLRSKERREKSPSAKMAYIFRNRLKLAIWRYKTNKTVRSLTFAGCSIFELVEHIESKFLDSMNWGNHGKFGWHIDHIKPVSKFDLTSKKELKECFHYTNLQPLWWRDNLSKGNK